MLFIFLIIVSLFLYFYSICMITREAMVTYFLPKEIKKDHNNKKAIQRMRLLGARFDIKVVTLALLLPCLYLLIASLFNLTFTANIFSSVIFVLSFIFTSIIIGNYYYFKTYNNDYDVFVFGLVEDDTKAVLQNMYDDYPIIKIQTGNSGPKLLIIKDSFANAMIPMLANHYIWGIAFIIAAVKTPKFLNQFILPVSSGLSANSVYSTARLGSMARRVIKR